MTVFRPDTSFPFLKIAREHNQPYGDVVRMAADVAHRLRLGRDFERAIRWNMSLDGPAAALLCDVVHAIEAENRRRATIIHDAMHTGDAP